jgi:hypothetical protein
MLPYPIFAKWNRFSQAGVPRIGTTPATMTKPDPTPQRSGPTDTGPAAAVPAVAMVTGRKNI